MQKWRVRFPVHELPDRKPCDSGIKATVMADFRKDPVLRRQTRKRNEESKAQPHDAYFYLQHLQLKNFEKS